MFSPGIEYSSGEGPPTIPCFRCGKCCTRYRVGITPADARRIARTLGITLREFLTKYADPYWRGRDGFFLRQEEQECIFLEHQDRRTAQCTIYPVRPEKCRKWIPSIYCRECRQGLAEIWGITISPSGSLAGSETDLREFYEHLKSLGEKKEKKFQAPA